MIMVLGPHKKKAEARAEAEAERDRSRQERPSGPGVAPSRSRRAARHQKPQHRPTPRLTKTSARRTRQENTAAMPKIKTHTGAKKRIKVTGKRQDPPSRPASAAPAREEALHADPSARPAPTSCCTRRPEKVKRLLGK